MVSAAAAGGDCGGGVVGACASAAGTAVKAMTTVRSNARIGTVRLRIGDFIEISSIIR